MSLAIGCWLLAMFSGMAWARMYTGALTFGTVLAFVWAQGSTLASWAGWLQVLAFGATPWLLAAQQEREAARLEALRKDEAAQMARLSDAARSLLSLQTAAKETEARIAEITDLYHVTQETARALHVQELFSASLTIAPRLLSVSGLRLIDLSGTAPQVWRASRAPDGRLIPSDGAAVLPLEQAILDQATSATRPSGTTVQVSSRDVPAGLSHVAWVLLWREQQPLGVLVADALPQEQQQTLAIIANQLSLQCSRISLYQQVEALAVTDALTGVSVRGHFMDRARDELARAKRHRLSCTVMMIDLDLFKQKNDRYGHLVGDVVLRDVARLVARNLRDIDLIARYGGEEFILLLIETPVEQAMPIAQRLRQLVEVHPIRAYDELLSQTLSVGMAGFPDHGQTLEQLVERADEALYAAKRAGRNRVIAWTPPVS